MRTFIRLGLLCAFTLSLYAQQQPTPAKPKPDFPHGTLAGTVVEEGSKAPIERAQVSVIASNGQENGSQTDAEGKFGGPLAPGSYRVTVRRRGRSGNVGSVVIEVTSIQVDKETKLEIRVPKTGEVQGRVLDHRGEPIPNARVTLMLRGYQTRNSDTTYQATPFTAETNDLGEYILTDVPGGTPFYIYAEAKFAQAIESFGPAPRVAEATATLAADINARLPVLASSFYPSSIDPAGGQSILLANGEIRERLDIRLVRAPSLCAEGQVLPAPFADAPHTINLEKAEVGVGVFNDIGAFRTGRTVRLGAQGVARVCNLWPGTYNFTVQPESPQQPNAFFGSGRFTVTDKDITSLAVNGAPVFDWQGEVTIDGAIPDPIQNRLQVRTISTTVTSVGRGATSDIPGKFTLPQLHFDQYLLVMGGFPDGWYVKNILYGDVDLKQRVGLSLNQANTPVKIVLSPKGAKIKVKVTDDKGQPVAGMLVNLVRRDLKQAQDLVGRMMKCYSDERGECSVFTLVLEPPYTTVAPGEYTVLAADLPYNKTADAYDQIWKTLQTDGTKVTLNANTTTDVSIKATKLR